MSHHLTKNTCQASQKNDQFFAASNTTKIIIKLTAAMPCHIPCIKMYRAQNEFKLTCPITVLCINYMAEDQMKYYRIYSLMYLHFKVTHLSKRSNI